MMNTDDAALRIRCASSRSAAAASTCALCLCSVANAFLVISVFSYTGYMVLALLPPSSTMTPDTVGTYAGLLASSFMMGRLLTAYLWGRLADRYGRLVVLRICLVGSAVGSLLFGTAQTFRQAIVWRCFLGMCNGILSITKTLATEVAHGNEVWEKRNMGLVVGMRSWGMLISPAIGGFLAEPVAQYPGLMQQWQAVPGWVQQVLVQFPFVLPNCLGALLCLSAVLAIHFCVEETLPKERRHSIRELPSHTWSHIRDSWCCCSTIKPHLSSSMNEEERQLLPSSSSRGRAIAATDCESIGDTARQQQEQHPLPWKRPLTRQHMICHWMFSTVTTYVDEAFPLFCMGKIGGLALLESSIGTILSLAGLIFAVFQYMTFSTLTHRYGLYRCLAIGSQLGTWLCCCVPVSIYFKDRLGLVTVTLALLMGVSKLFQSLFFTSMAVAINKTVDSSQRATMNATVLMGNSISKAIGPILAGTYVSFSFSRVSPFPPQFGGWLIWIMVPVLGSLTLVQVKSLQKRVDESKLENSQVQL